MGFFEKFGFGNKAVSPEAQVPQENPAGPEAKNAPNNSAAEAGPEAEKELSPEIKNQISAEMRTLDQVPKPQSAMKRKLQRATSIAMASLTLTAATPAFSEAGSRNGPGQAIEDGFSYVIDSYYRQMGQSMEDARQARERQQRAAEEEARRQQLMAEDEARRRQMESERAAEQQQNYERRKQQDAENDFRREQADFRNKLNGAIEDYNRRLAEIDRSYENKRLGTPGTPEAMAARSELAKAARENYIQQVIDYKTAYGQPLTEQEQRFADGHQAAESGK